MSTDTDGEAEPVTDHVHENSWSANLETQRYAADRSLVVSHAVDAVEQTASGNHVNLVTHGDHGHPEEYLYSRLEAALDGIAYEYVEQCGCGGHVTRVHVE